MAKVKINFADVEELKTLPGIVKAIATNIVQSRQTAGNIIMEDLGNLPDKIVRSYRLGSEP